MFLCIWGFIVTSKEKNSMQKSQFTNIINKSMVNALLKGYQLYDVGSIGAEKKNEPQFVLLKNNDIQSLVVVPTSKDSTTCIVNFVANIAKDHEEALSVATEEEIIRILEKDITKTMQQNVDEACLQEAERYIQQVAQTKEDAFLVSLQEKLQTSQRGR